MDTLWQLGLFAGLILLNGWLAMAEFSVLRVSRAPTGSSADPRGRELLELTRDLGRFLAAVQVGLTATAILLGALGELSLAGPLASWLEARGLPPPLPAALATGAIALALSGATLLLGELVPKRLALAFPYPIAHHAARPMHRLLRGLGWVVGGLDRLAEGILRLLGVPTREAEVTEGEIQSMIDRAASSGALERLEHELIDRVFRLDRRSLQEVMTPLREIVWLDLEESQAAWRETLRRHPHEHYPAGRGSPERALGVLPGRRLLGHAPDPTLRQLQGMILPVPALGPEGTLLEALKIFRRTGAPLLFIRDEPGRLRGLLTHHDLLEAVVGRIRPGRPPRPGPAPAGGRPPRRN